MARDTSKPNPSSACSDAVRSSTMPQVLMVVSMMKAMRARPRRPSKTLKLVSLKFRMYAQSSVT
eukprot:6413072-Pyramimonas_sp.AAC.1